MIELPYLTWIDQFSLAGKYFDMSLIFKDLFTTYGEHGLFGYNLLFLGNVKFFNLTTFFDVYLNDINVIIVCFISVFVLRKVLTNIKSAVYVISVIAVCSYTCSFIQGSSGAMETQVRLGILFFVLSALMIDKYLLTEKHNFGFAVFTIILIFFSINVFGTIYSFAAIAIIVMLLFINFFTKQVSYGKYLAVVASYCIASILYFFEYSLIGKGSMESSTIFIALSNIAMHPLSTMKAILGYNASVMLGYPVYTNHTISDNLYLLIGAIITSIYIYSIIRYYQTRLYKKTFLPILFMGYSFFVLILTMIGRYDSNWCWYVNEWYTVHTKLGMVGCLIILAYDYNYLAAITQLKRKKIMLIVLICLLTVGVWGGDFVAFARSPYVKEYYLDKQKYLFVQDISKMPIDSNGLTPLLHTPLMTENAIDLMEEHSLSIYHKYSNYNEYIYGNTGYNIENIFIVNGYSQDGWIEQNAELFIRSSNKGKIILSLYYPYDITGEQSGIIYANGNPTRYIFNNNNISIEIDCEPNSLIDLRIINDFSFQSTPPDTRILSFILKDVQGK